MTETKKISIYSKLLDFQKLEIIVAKDGKNDYFKKKEGGREVPSKYVTLNEVLEKVKKPLNEMGIVIIFAPEADGLRTTLYDTESETKIEGYMKYVGADNAQKLLACNTYFRRGTLVSLLGIEDEDDDGNKASAPTPVAKPVAKDIFTQTKQAIEEIDSADKLNALSVKFAGSTKLTPDQKEELALIAHDKLAELNETQFKQLKTWN